jgi:hypothetical protein
MEKTERQSNIDLTGYPKLINNDILNKIANRRHPMAKMPYYHKKNEPQKLHEEDIIEDRFKGLVDSYTNTFGGSKEHINQIRVMMNAGANGMEIMRSEKPKRRELVSLVERIMREEFNIDRDEVLFDLEIVDVGSCELPDEMDTEKEIKDDFEQTDDFDILKKRTINAFSQGAALASHYIFHMYKNDFERICPDITPTYQRALIANDLFYFMLDDSSLQSQLCGGESGANAGYCRLNFDGDIPVIEAKAISAPILLHEVTKALITFFSIPGIQNMDKETIDETDYVMAELWDIRFGTTLWVNFHSLIDERDYDIKKLIFVEVFKMDSEMFVKDFMYNVMNKPELAKKEIDFIVRKIRNKITEYQFEKDSDGIDLSDLGIF